MRISALLLAMAVTSPAQDLTGILQRLEKLEQQNLALAAEVAELKKQLASRETSSSEVQENRTEELQQIKVESSQKLPISITGMALFNLYSNGAYNGGLQVPNSASAQRFPRSAGATFRQTVLGLQFQSPTGVLGAEIAGNLYFDFFANPSGQNAPVVNLNNLARLRIATIEARWKHVSLSVGQDKPLISVREPVSLAQVGVSPLTGAGNPWLWQPQVRLETRLPLGTRSQLRPQFSIIQTAETSANVPANFASTLETSRPGWEFRLPYRYDFGNDRMVEIAGGVHLSTTHVAGTSVPSRLYTFDWLITPIQKIEFSGLFYRSQNIAHLGTNRQGFVVLGPGRADPIHGYGGWAQLAYSPTLRWQFHFYGGQQDDRDRDLLPGSIGRNFTYAANTMYRIAPNVIVSWEARQARTQYVNLGKRLNNRYDLAIAYLF